jgi:hypothetical protein
MSKTITKVLAAAAVVLTLGAASQAAEAHVSWSIGIGVPGYVAAPAYYPPAPVYVAPPPVVYAPPPPVYYPPRPVYYQPAPVYVRPAPRYYAPPPVYSPSGYWQGGVFYRH